VGLDQYAYVASKADQWDSARDIAYWRKHPNLQGWMRRLWESQGNSGDFNGAELELTWKDLEDLEQDILDNRLAAIQETGFFFGDASDEYYRQRDLEFIKNAKAELFLGLKVFYNSSW